jgi:TLD
MTTPATVQLTPLSLFSSAHKDERKEDPPVASVAPPPPPVPTTKSPPKPCLRSNPVHDPLLAARSRGLLKAMIDRFSSTPLDLSSSFSADEQAQPPRNNHHFRRNDTGVNDNDDDDDDQDADESDDDESSAWLHNSVVVSPAASRQPTPPASSNSRRSSSFASNTGGGSTSSGLLTDAERNYLDQLLQSGNAADMEAASRALGDPEVFFDEGSSGAETAQPALTAKSAAAALDKMKLRTDPLAAVGRDRRDSRLQQQLYHLHETTSVQPSLVISRISLLLQKVQQQYKSQSIVQTSFSNDDDLNSIMSSDVSPQHKHPSAVPKALSRDNNNSNEHDDWDPFEDVTAWLDGGEHGMPPEAASAAAVLTSSSTVPFKILGTYGSDATCHPHVLSPPLMEALLNFCPEAAAVGMASSSVGAATTTTTTTTTANFWLKYSRVRDGGNLAQLLRQVRASTYTIVAVETSTGHVLGSFTSHPWRLSSKWYGGNDSQRKYSDGPSNGAADLEASSFVWKMRHPRCLVGSTSPVSKSPSPTLRRSIVEQVCQESEIQVFPIRSSSDAAVECDAVQSCSLTHGLRLGQNELRHLSPKHRLSGEHLGHALAIAPDLLTGSTSTSETFGNPCLTNEALRGEAFDIVNVEVWTLTPHGTIAEAERRELARLFLHPER